MCWALHFSNVDCMSPMSIYAMIWYENMWLSLITRLCHGFMVFLVLQMGHSRKWLFWTQNPKSNDVFDVFGKGLWSIEQVCNTFILVNYFVLVNWIEPTTTTTKNVFISCSVNENIKPAEIRNNWSLATFDTKSNIGRLINSSALF